MTIKHDAHTDAFVRARCANYSLEQLKEGMRLAEELARGPDPIEPADEVITFCIVRELELRGELYVH